MKTIEHAIRDKILYIGNEIPSSLCNDARSKFIVLGSPQELIDETGTESQVLSSGKKWTKAEMDKHIQTNCKEEVGSCYSMVVVLAALYMKLYGFTFPELGLSGFQGENAEALSKMFPNPTPPPS